MKQKNKLLDNAMKNQKRCWEEYAVEQFVRLSIKRLETEGDKKCADTLKKLFVEYKGLE